MKKPKRLERHEPHTDEFQLWSPAYIIADLIATIDAVGYPNNITMDKYVGEGDYCWIYQAIMYMREEYAKGAVMNAFAAQWCDPEHRFYKEFNVRWCIRGYEV